VNNRQTQLMCSYNCRRVNTAILRQDPENRIKFSHIKMTTQYIKKRNMALLSNPDLDIFSSIDSHQPTIPQSIHKNEFDNTKLEIQIEHNCRRATMVSDATTQIMLAAFDDEGSSQQFDRFELAEQIAYDLGYQEHSSLSLTENQNPFSTTNLQQAWDNGFVRSATDNKNKAHKALEQRLWSCTTSTDSHSTQYSLAAFALFSISENSISTEIRSRASSIANELLAYNESNPPSKQRQQEIDQFLSLQSLRLAKEINI